MAIDFNNSGLTQSPDTGTIPNWQQPSTSDPKAKKCVTENELGLMTMWAWGASKSSLSTTYCPEYEDIKNSTYNTIPKTGPINGEDVEESYNIVTSTLSSNDKLLKRESVTKTEYIYFTINVNHDLDAAPGDYSIAFFLSNSASSTESICTFNKTAITKPGKSGNLDYPVRFGLINLINSQSSISRNAYVGVELDGSRWTYAKDIQFGVKKWNSSSNSWSYITTSTITTAGLKEFGTNVKTLKCNLGITWRSLIANRYRIILKLTPRNSSK